MNAAVTRCLVLLFIGLSPVAQAAEQDHKPADKGGDTKAATTCEHGVKATICARCNPKLEPIFRAKKDWCEEHKRPESQCSLCHPELKKKGIK